MDSPFYEFPKICSSLPLKPSLEVFSKSRFLLSVQGNLGCLISLNLSSLPTVWFQSQSHIFRHCNSMTIIINWLMSPKKTLKSSSPVLVNVTFFGNKAFANDQVRMRSSGWALIHYDGLNKKVKFGHEDRHAHKENII